jgi:prepilin-type processing-associated H-X9-DG protein
MELMIAIVIILVLVAMTVPAVRALRERAQSAQCVQNLRQIGVALQAHISENGGRFPNGKAHVSWLKDDDNSSLGLSWYDAAANHMGREKFSNRFNDPNADPLPEAFGCPSGHGKAYHPAWPYTGDYAGNLYLGQSNQGVMTISAVKNPAATPYVQDTVKQNNFGAWIFGSGFSQTADAAFAARHRGKGNILWVDGRVTSLSHAEYMKLANNNRYGGVLNFMKGNW